MIWQYIRFHILYVSFDTTWWTWTRKEKKRIEKTIQTVCLIACRTVYRHNNRYQSHSSIFSLTMSEYLCLHVYMCLYAFIFCVLFFLSFCRSVILCHLFNVMYNHVRSHRFINLIEYFGTKNFNIQIYKNCLYKIYSVAKILIIFSIYQFCRFCWT